MNKKCYEMMLFKCMLKGYIVEMLTFSVSNDLKLFPYNYGRDNYKDDV